MMQHEVHVTAVLLRGSVCASGDRSGKIRLWQLSDFKPTLQKTMDGHSDSVSALRMDEAHLVSASRDGFVRIWSLTGDLTSCLGQLPHPSAVLCLELRYLRIITGCADGRVRLWNLLTQHCQRVMLGNYRRDPVLSIVALRNRKPARPKSAYAITRAIRDVEKAKLNLPTLSSPQKSQYQVSNLLQVRDSVHPTQDEKNTSISIKNPRRWSYSLQSAYGESPSEGIVYSSKVDALKMLLIQRLREKRQHNTPSDEYQKMEEHLYIDVPVEWKAVQTNRLTPTSENKEQLIQPRRRFSDKT
ncbi:uncharacterized protein DEA37_0012177 [Paragonimus westermani]|uniref:Uncharacterized protein n=1 Tax=Paragonimus westermani TaxID=34504 RepID=A0A5J4NJW0_9TREM|nr:uncharacterized protein DEA37_0012177 [Paragonimus westermani]